MCGKNPIAREVLGRFADAKVLLHDMKGTPVERQRQVSRENLVSGRSRERSQSRVPSLQELERLPALVLARIEFRLSKRTGNTGVEDQYEFVERHLLGTLRVAPEMKRTVFDRERGSELVHDPALNADESRFGAPRSQGDLCSRTVFVDELRQSKRKSDFQRGGRAESGAGRHV